MSLTNIIGPVMVGPSSSHTAGAVRIGLMARTLLKDTPVDGEILLHGSFAKTGKGHGTDKAIIAGILGLTPDDMHVPASFELAQEKNFTFTIGTTNLGDASQYSTDQTAGQQRQGNRSAGFFCRRRTYHGQQDRWDRCQFIEVFLILLQMDFQFQE